jgi:hypothetical protein
MTSFDNLIAKKNILDETMSKMNGNLSELKNEHKIFTQTHISDDETFIFGLDSLHFQYAIMNFEYESFNKQYIMIRNRMYCENYKLHKLIIKYVSTVDSIHTSFLTDNEIVPHASAKDLEMNTEPYDDLDAFKDYDFDCICELYAKNIDVIQLLQKISNYKSSILTNYTAKQSKGFNVSNFVISFDCEIQFIESRIKMFNDYVNALTTTHTENICHLIKNISNSFYEENNDTYILRQITPESDPDSDPIPPPLVPPLIPLILPHTRSKQNSEVDITGLDQSAEIIDPTDPSDSANSTVELTDFSAGNAQPE